MSDPHTPSLTGSVLEPLVTSLNALQSQFAAFQEDLCGVKSDVSDVLVQLDALRKAQNTTYMAVAQLEDVIGIPTDAKSKARAGRRRGGGATAGSPDAQTTPEKTLLQSLASIQFTVDELLAHESRPSSSPETSSSPMPSQEPCETSSSSISITDPSQHRPELTERAPANMHSKEHCMSIQARASLPGSYPFPQTWGYVPWFNPVYWNYSSSTPGLSVTNSMRPTAHTPEYLAQFLRDAHHPGIQNIVTHEHAPRGDLHGLMTQYDQSSPPTNSILPAASSSLPTSAIPPFHGGLLPTTESSSSTSSSIQSLPSQTWPLAAEGTCSSVTLASTVPRIDSRASSSPLRSLSGIGDIAMSFSDVSQPEEPLSCVVQPQKVIGEGATAFSEDGISTTVVAENDDLTSYPPTPRSEIFTNDQGSRVAGRLSSNATDPRVISRSTHTRDCPVIPTLLSQTLEPSVGDRGQDPESAIQDPHDSPPTPQSSTFPSAMGSFLEKGDSGASRQVGAQKAIEQHPDPTVDARFTVVCGDDVVEGLNADALMNDASSRPERSEKLFEKSTVGMGSGTLVSPATVDVDYSKVDDARLSLQIDRAGFTSVSVAKIGREPQSIATSMCDSSQVATEDVDLPITPTSLAGDESSEHRPGTNVIGSTSSPTDEHGFGSTSPLHLPLFLSSAATSRYATPPGSPDLRFTRDEEEVWSALIDTSGMSTPVPDDISLMMLSQPPTRPPTRLPSVRPHTPQQNPALASTHAGLASLDHTSFTSVPQLLAVVPSMLHDAPYGFEPRSGSLSSLTSLDDSDVDEPVATQADEEPSASTSTGGVTGARESSYEQRCSEPYRARSRLSGGPNASLNELAVLARRKPLKIHLVVPESLRNSKRKRDAVDGEMTERESCADGTAIQAELASGSVSPGDMGEGTSASIMAIQRTLESSPSREVTPVPRKKKKKQSEHLGINVHETLPISNDQQKTKRTPGSRQKSQEMFHFRRGQIVTVNWELPVEHKVEVQQLPQALVTPPVSQSPAPNDKVGQDSRTPTQMCHDNQAMKTPSSSSVNLPLLNLPNASTVGSSHSKQDECGGTWPKLPDLFQSQWHMQFIQCDICDKWFHYGCVAIESGDRRLEPEASFVCPPCYTESSGCQTPFDRENTCARPDCPEPLTTGDSGHFFVEKLVGLKRVEGYFHMWLAKWEGYPMSEATWIPKENMDGDGTKLCNAFLEDAKRQGADISQDMVLLKEAVEAGWGDVMNTF